MQVTIKEKNDNPLLGRVEIKGQIIFEGATPSNAQLVEILVKDMKTEASLVVVKNIYTKFSQQEAEFSALVYKNAETKNKAEMDTKFLRKKAEEAKKKAEEEAKAAAEAAPAEEKPTEEKPAEAPAEETKEEVPVEEKPAEEKKE